MTKQKLPFMSVVMPVYNGGATVGRAVESLLAQDYPKDRFEIITVNDGSTDNTPDILHAYPTVRSLDLPRNMGIPAAQNAGLNVARGDVYVSFNDDCKATPDFLSQLAKGYAEFHKPLGIGGIVVRQRSGRLKGVMAHYIEACSRGAAPNAAGVGPAFLPMVLRRFLAYVVGNFTLKQDDSNDQREYEEVVELYGANASFPIAMLRQVDGWDESMAAPAVGGIEDRDVCFRLRQKFPDHVFYSMRAARVMLEQDPSDTAVSMKSYLLRPYRRGPFNFAFHVRNGLTPPLFPLPLLILLSWLAGAIFALPLVPLLVVLLPQLFYAWWLWRAVRERRPLYALFPYIQLAEETMVLAGLLRGFIVHNRKKYATD